MICMDLMILAYFHSKFSCGQVFNLHMISFVYKFSCEEKHCKIADDTRVSDIWPLELLFI